MVFVYHYTYVGILDFNTIYNIYVVGYLELLVIVFYYAVRLCG